MPLDIVEIIFLLSCIGTSLIWPYIVCYFANITTHRMALIGETIFNSNWFDYPPELQKYTILIIARSHYPSKFKCYGLFNCTLEAFGNVRFLIFMFQVDLTLSLLFSRLWNHQFLTIWFLDNYLISSFNVSIF